MDYQLAAAGLGGSGGSALLIMRPMCLINSGHLYLNAFLSLFHPVVTALEAVIKTEQHTT